MIAACVSSMYGRGICPCHHNFCGSSPFSFDFTAERVAGITIKAEIPIKTVRVYDDLGDEGLDHRFRYIRSFVDPLHSFIFFYGDDGLMGALHLGEFDLTVVFTFFASDNPAHIPCGR